ncbi:uncharacterized protein [Apostichopus japonicus]|uniref:uncharacterized protein isoform X2 n=1 Tax=Stichopus japonicus TaxID=307972 RepID=UPI003AB1CA8B
MPHILQKLIRRRKLTRETLKRFIKHQQRRGLPDFEKISVQQGLILSSTTTSHQLMMSENPATSEMKVQLEFLDRLLQTFTTVTYSMQIACPPHVSKSGPSGYNLFCQDISKDLKHLNNKDKFKSFAVRWANTSGEEKEMYRRRASGNEPTSMTEDDRLKEWRRSKRRILAETNRMNALLPDFAWYMVYQSGEELSYTGSSEGVSFVEEYAEETSSMFSVYLRVTANNTGTNKKVTAKDIQDIFNEKYEAVGIPNAKMPYSQVEVLGIKMEGMPDGMNIRLPSRYGGKQRRAIHAVKDNLICVISNK